MKVVFLADDSRNGSQVAVAVINGHAENFEDEVSLARQVHHPNVVPILDSGLGADGRPFIVSEYCPGAPLRERLNSQGVLRQEEAVRVSAQIAAGLAAIHHAHVLHRDIKPENILMVGDVAKIIDFGVSLRSENSITAPLPPVPLGGTPAYMAVEAFRDSGAELDARTDVYALGVCVFEMLSGRVPLKPARYWFEHLQELERIAAHDLSPISSATDKLRSLVASMIAIEKDCRPFMPEVHSALLALEAQLN
jgi:serine/threonine-protein kinase